MADTLEVLRRALADRYRVERPLGRGGMATVYLAQDLKHDRPVAIKVLRPDLAAMLGPDRFLREIQIAAKLNHPHILALYDSGQAEGLLYYVMPHVAGESLLQRIDREKQLSIDEALRLTKEVAAALAYAHAQGVIHRDIKPANILLSEGYALVADFGLARALSSARDSGAITQSGITIGTPAYMSPEQSSGEDADGRSDLYALGCVLYEMLAGDPPFTSSNPGAVLARHASAPVPPIRVVRTTVPAWLEKVVLKALAKAPADRYQSAEAMSAALVAPAEAEVAARARTVRRWRAVGFGAVAVALAAVAWSITRTPGGSLSPRGTDSTLYAVLPFEFIGGRPGPLGLDQSVHDAVARWGGVTVVDGIQVAEAVRRRGDSVPLTANEAERIAARLAAGRLIRGEIAPKGDSIQLRLGLYGVGLGKLRESSVRIAATLSGMDSAVVRAVDQLLVPSAGTGNQPAPPIGSHVLPAIQAFVRGDSALLQWNLPAADSAFSSAMTLDPGYAQAALWLALVRAWGNAPPVRWRFAIEQAVANRERLASRDRQFADALVAQGGGDYLNACRLWRQLTRSDRGSFAGWFGLATCLRRDGAVVKDAQSPSGWRFRASYHEAVLAYRRAFELLPSIHVGLRSDGYMRLRGDILYTTGRNLRPGKALAPDTTSFLAYPEWAGDTLVFYPFPSDVVIRGASGRQEQRREGVLRQRRVFLQIAQSWVSAYPNSSDALEALALSLELLGDPSALDTLRRARRAAHGPAEALRVAASEVWIRLKFALPDDRSGLMSVRALTDTLLRHVDGPDALDPAVLVGIAALRGRARLAADLASRSGSIGGVQIPLPLKRDGPALWAYAALGAPLDTLRLLDRRVAEAIEASPDENTQSSPKSEWLGRAATLAFPEARLRGLTLAGLVDPLLKSQAAAAAGRSAEARALFDQLRIQRKDVPPERITFDALFPEAKLLEFLGDDRAAADWLDPPLTSLSRTAPQALADMLNAADLVRSMAMRADLAERMGDHATAVRWGAAVAILWTDADAFLGPLVRRMASLGH